MNYARFLLNGTVLGLALTLVAATPGFAEKTTPPAAATAASIDFGDDTSEWAKDGECDDPRFTGQGAASELVAADIKKDATDCKAAFDAGTVTLKDGAPTTPATTNTPAVATTGAAVDFGDDTSEWSKDGECDDPRFTGTGVSSDPSAVDIKKDATDCEAAVKAGTATAKDGAAPTATTDTPATPATTDTPASTAAVDFGDDAGQWPKDGECDDPRFIGSAAAEAPEDVDTMHDATDCKTAFEAGTVTVKTAAVDGPTPTLADVDFGDDTGQYPKDGECDDPRFTGTAAADEPDDADIRKDATDCKAAFGAGTVTLKGDGTTAAVDFGSDTSKYAKDGECDDPRFTGPGTDKKLLAEDKMADATDCQALLNAGSVTLRAVFDPNYVAGAPYDPGTIDFGDNASSYASDGECDDPRFEGPGLADSPVAENKWHDHDDCLAAFQAGTVALAQ